VLESSATHALGIPENRGDPSVSNNRSDRCDTSTRLTRAGVIVARVGR
jgi:hypothetical protein